MLSCAMWQVRAGTEIMATSRQALNEILSHVEFIKVDMQTQLQFDEKTAHDTVAIMCTVDSCVEDIAEKVDKSIAVFGARMSKVCFNVSAEKGARYQLEQLLWTERMRVRELGLSLVESNQTAKEAVVECFELSAQLEKISDEKSTLERQVTEEFVNHYFLVLSAPNDAGVFAAARVFRLI